MAEIDFLPVAIAEGSNVDTQADYAGSAFQTTGAVAGTASSAKFNKAIRQSSVMVAAFATFLSQQLGGADVIDDGNLVGLTSLITQAMDELVSNQGLTLGEVNAATLTQATQQPGDNTTKLATTAFLQAALAAFATSSLQQNGYIKLGAFVLQWGYQAATNQNFAFPMAFPNVAYCLIVSSATTGGQYNDAAYGRVIDKATFFMGTKGSQQGNLSAYGCYWLAIGS